MREKYTVQEASDLTGLSVQTLRSYPYVTDLVRGEDYYVSRFARFRRRTWWTPRGIARLKTRSYRVAKVSHSAQLPELDHVLPRSYAGTSAGESSARTRNRMLLAFTRYLQNPCAVPNCPCMTHRLGLPQADEIAIAMSKAKDRK